MLETRTRQARDSRTRRQSGVRQHWRAPRIFRRHRRRSKTLAPVRIQNRRRAPRRRADDHPLDHAKRGSHTNLDINQHTIARSSRASSTSRARRGVCACPLVHNSDGRFVKCDYHMPVLYARDNFYVANHFVRCISCPCECDRQMLWCVRPRARPRKSPVPRRCRATRACK